MFSQRFVIAVLFLTFMLAWEQVRAGTLLHDNGPFITGDGIDVCPDAPGGSNTSSPAFGSTGGVQTYWVQGRVIDDFTIPNGESWSIESLRWRAYQTGTLYDASIPTAFVRLWAGDPLAGGEPIWGDFETNRQINSTFSGVFRTGNTNLTSCARAIKNVDIDMSALPPLPPGRYWIEVGLDSDLPGGLFSPPTEPRLPADNALQLDFSGVAESSVDAASSEPLEFPFQLFGQVISVATSACVMMDGSCVDATLADCTNVLGGTFNYLHPCAALGACCNHADGVCDENVSPEDCTGAGHVFHAGQSCASIPNCGLTIGACCFPDEVPTHCQSLARGVTCAADGGFWHTGSCSGISCDDFCETARTIFDGQTPFDTIGYGTERVVTPNDCGNSPFVGLADAWFRYVSTVSNSGGTIEISLCSTSFDTTLQVYQMGAGTSCVDPAGTSIATYCDNDGCGAGGASYLSIPANTGDEFLIRIGGFDGATGGGMIRITTLENGQGTCCSISAPCRVVSEQDCQTGLESFTPGVLCDTPGFSCPEIGGCCRGAAGCQIDLQNLCEQSGGFFLGGGSVCGAADDCDGDGETNRCALALGAADCNGNGIPDSCDIAPGGAASDCDFNGIPDSCQPPTNCCPGDVNGDAVLDSRDIQGFLSAMFDGPQACFTRPFCRLDLNGDFAFDEADIAPFVSALLFAGDCPILIHVTGRVDLLDEAGQITGHANQVYVLDEQGALLYAYDQVPNAAADQWGYRDGASDGTYLYFGWAGGVARHDADGAGGVQIIFGPVPGTGATWRALAYDPTGDGGNGSLWTQSFTSNLVETDMSGNLLNSYFNGLNLYGLAFDRDTGMLWGHDLEVTDFFAQMVEIDPSNGQPTGVVFPSHFNLPGGSLNGLAQYGGVSFDPRTGTLYGLLQGSPGDAIFHCDTSGNLLSVPHVNPRADINFQTGTTRNLGIVISRP
ncbi:MAG: hypothetical protein H6818_05735 [Phycisphaerales bacterium]|nr:hypothetical protein [Phycisphaerales bacterium]MCB9862763.1 hypothetical protein [Phycisphaerales bacterium]